MKKLSLTTASLASLLISLGSGAFAHAQDIPLIGVTDDGAPVEVVMNGSEYQKNLEKSLSHVKNATQSALDRKPAHGGWALKSVVAGIGLQLEAGLGPVLKASAVPRFRVVFTPSKDVLVP